MCGSHLCHHWKAMVQTCHSSQNVVWLDGVTGFMIAMQWQHISLPAFCLLPFWNYWQVYNQHSGDVRLGCNLDWNCSTRVAAFHSTPLSSSTHCSKLTFNSVESNVQFICCWLSDTKVHCISPHSNSSIIPFWLSVVGTFILRIPGETAGHKTDSTTHVWLAWPEWIMNIPPTQRRETDRKEGRRLPYGPKTVDILPPGLIFPFKGGKFHNGKYISRWSSKTPLEIYINTRRWPVV